MVIHRKAVKAFSLGFELRDYRREMLEQRFPKHERYQNPASKDRRPRAVRREQKRLEEQTKLAA